MQERGGYVTDSNSTLTKGLKLIDLFKDYDHLTLQEMATLSGMPKTTVHRMVNSLVQEGFLAPRKNDGYTLGLKFLHFGTIVKDRLDLRRIAVPFMKSLEQTVHEVVNLIVLRHQQALYIESVETDKPLRVHNQIGRTSPLYVGAGPRVLLAYMPDEERTRILDTTQFAKLASRTIIYRDLLDQECERIQQDGFSVSHSEATEGYAAVGAPVWDSTGRVIAALAIAGPEHRFRHDRLPTLIESTVNTAQALSNALGYLNHTP